MSLAGYAAVVVTILAVTLGASSPWWASRDDVRASVLVGAGLATVNALLAFATVRWAAPRRQNVFLGAILGGMVVRMIAMLGAVAWIALRVGLPTVPLAVSLLAYFTLFLALEMKALHRTNPAAEAA